MTADEPLHIDRVFDVTYLTLRRRILSGELPGGTPLRVPALSHAFNVSRSPVREAVAQLVADGLAVAQPRRGAVVRRFTVEEIADLYLVRTTLESLAARLVAERGAWEPVRAHFERQRAALADDDREAFAEASVAFHAAIAEGSGSPTLGETLASLQARMHVAMRQGTTVVGHMQCATDEHRAIVAALAEHRGEEAAHLMSHHLEQTRLRLTTPAAETRRPSSR